MGFRMTRASIYADRLLLRRAENIVDLIKNPICVSKTSNHPKSRCKDRRGLTEGVSAFNVPVKFRQRGDAVGFDGIGLDGKK